MFYNKRSSSGILKLYKLVLTHLLVLQYHPWRSSRRGILVHSDLDVVDGVCLNTFEGIQLKPQRLAQLQVVRILRDNLVAVIYGTVSIVSEHFNLPRHSVNDIRLIPLKLMHTNRDSVRKAREAHLIE